MRSRPTTVRRRLLALNAVLLAALVGVTAAPPADAQNQPGQTRPRGEYTMVGGEITGASTNAVHIIDAANQEMVSLLWDQSRRRLDGIGYRDLSTDLTLAPER